MSTRTTAVFCAAGITVVVLCAVLTAIDPVVKFHATNAGIVVLALFALGGILARLVAPLADLWTEESDTLSETAPVSASESALTAGPARPTGDLR